MILRITIIKENKCVTEVKGKAAIIKRSKTKTSYLLTTASVSDWEPRTAESDKLQEME